MFDTNLTESYNNIYIYTVTNLRPKFSGQNISLQVDINVGFNKYLIIITSIYYYIIIFNYYFRVSFFCGWVGVYVRERGDIHCIWGIFHINYFH